MKKRRVLFFGIGEMMCHLEHLQPLAVRRNDKCMDDGCWGFGRCVGRRNWLKSVALESSWREEAPDNVKSLK